MIVGIRPEDLEDAALKPETPEDRRLRGKMMLREALGSEINVHFEIEAPPVLTEDTKELAEDIGTRSSPRGPREAERADLQVRGRFDPHTRVQAGDDVEIAVDTRALHFFDLESGSGSTTSAGHLIHGPKARGADAARIPPGGSTMNRSDTSRGFCLASSSSRRSPCSPPACGKSPEPAPATGSPSAAANVSGNVSVMAVWSGAEQKAFQTVIDGFTAKYPDVTVKYTSAGDQLPTVLSTAVQGGNPPDIAAVAAAGPDEGLRRPRRAEADHVRQERARGELRAQLDRPRHGRREALRLLLQGRQQVDRLVQRPARSRTPA